MSFRIDRGQVIPVQNDNTKRSEKAGVKQPDFQRLLQQSIQKSNEVKISAHAKQRMEERNIELDNSDMDAIKGAMDTLEQKGALNSLMMYKDFAFIASIRNRTIITSIANDELDVVTNIDSAILVK